MRHLRPFAVFSSLQCCASYFFLPPIGSGMEAQAASSSIACAAEYLPDAPLPTIQPDQYLFDLLIVAAFHLILLFLFQTRHAAHYRAGVEAPCLLVEKRAGNRYLKNPPRQARIIWSSEGSNAKEFSKKTKNDRTFLSVCPAS